MDGRINFMDHSQQSIIGGLFFVGCNIYLWEEVVRGIVKNDDKGEDVTNCGVEDSHGTFSSCGIEESRSIRDRKEYFSGQGLGMATARWLVLTQDFEMQLQRSIYSLFSIISYSHSERSSQIHFLIN